MATATVLPDRLARFLLPGFHLRKGIGKGVNSHVDVCLMQAVSWLAGNTDITDSPPCASRVIGRYAIRLNDSWLFTTHRDLLKPYASRIVGTRSTIEIEVQRGRIAADYAVRVFAPIRLRFLRREELAKELESLGPITDKDSAILARDASRKIRSYAAADAAAYAAADAAAAAAADADAAAAAYVDAYADAAAAAAADAAAAASAAAYAAASAYVDAYAAAAADAAADAAAAAYAAASASAAAYAAADASAAASAAAYAAADAAADADAALREKSLECLDRMISYK